MSETARRTMPGGGTRTDPRAEDPRLWGRTYAIPFARVWDAAKGLSDGGLRGWSMVRNDDREGVIEAVSLTWLRRKPDQVTVTIRLDENAQTRVDLRCVRSEGAPVRRRHPRLINGFLEALDRTLQATPGQKLDPTATPGWQRVVPTIALVMVCGFAGCGDATPEPEPTTEGTQAAPAPEHVVERVYERSFAFVAELGDSLLLVPWLMTHQARPDSVLRDVAGWLSRGGTWEPFYRERWSTPATRSPERILPHGTLSIVVRDGDLVDGLVYQDGPRSLEIVMGEVIAAWVGPDGETFDLLEGAAFLSEERIDGMVVEVSRSWTPSEPPAGDWAFLVSGDSVRVVMAGNVEHGLDTEPVYRVWAQRGAEDLVWPEVEVDWSERQAFPPARRDVPTTWSIDSADGTLSGTLRSVTSEIEAGEGSGPLLPVLALVEVEGELEARGSTIPVRGILVHQRR